MIVSAVKIGTYALNVILVTLRVYPAWKRDMRRSGTVRRAGWALRSEYSYHALLNMIYAGVPRFYAVYVTRTPDLCIGILNGIT